MKTLREFAEDVLNQVTTGTGYLGEIVEKAENNGKITVCISIRKSGSMVGPMIKLEGYYEEYKESQNEETLYGISREIETIANKAWEQETEIVELGNEIKKGFPAVKDRIHMRLVNAEENQNRLKNIPWIPYLDLAITFHLNFDGDSDEQKSIEVNHQLIDTWNVTPEDLYQTALANMEREDDGTFYRLSDFVESVLHTTPESSGLDMYIMTNKKCAYGATEILRSGELKRRAEEFKSDLVVLPSSVHEVLVLPYEEWMDLDLFRRTVQNVNDDAVKREEQLSNQVYLYQKDKDRLMVA